MMQITTTTKTATTPTSSALSFHVSGSVTRGIYAAGGGVE